MDHHTTARKPIPRLSLGGAIGFVGSMIALAVVEVLHTPESSPESQRARVLGVMLCLLLAAWSSIASLVTAWCPVILGGDRRPLYWVVPLILGWMIFVQWFDWMSLVPPGRRGDGAEPRSAREASPG